MSEGQVIVQLAEDGGLDVVLDRADEGNVLTPAMTDALAAAFVNRPEGTKFIVLQGAGADFCAGRQSPMPPKGAKPMPEELRGRVAEPVLSFYQTLRDTPVPVITVVRGRALGVGCALAGLGDVIIAAEDAQFAIPEMDRDIPPLLVMTALADRISRAAHARLVFSRQPVNGTEAVAMGLASMAVAPGALDGAVADLRKSLSTNSETVLKTVKRFLNMAPEMSFAARRELASVANSGATVERFHK